MCAGRREKTHTYTHTRNTNTENQVLMSKIWKRDEKLNAFKLEECVEEGVIEPDI